MKRLYIGGLFPEITEDILKNKFISFGEVTGVDIKVRRDENGEVLKTFAHLNIEAEENKIQSCLQTLNNSKWKGSVIQIQIAKESYLDKLKREREIAQEKAKPAIVSKPDYVPKAKPGDMIPGESEWVVSKYGRPLPIMRLPKKTNPAKISTIDPSKYTHNIRRIKEDEEENKKESVADLTWDISDVTSIVEKMQEKCKSMDSGAKGIFKNAPKRKPVTSNSSDSDTSESDSSDSQSSLSVDKANINSQKLVNIEETSSRPKTAASLTKTSPMASNVLGVLDEKMQEKCKSVDSGAKGISKNSSGKKSLTSNSSNSDTSGSDSSDSQSSLSVDKANINSQKLVTIEETSSRPDIATSLTKTSPMACKVLDDKKVLHTENSMNGVSVLKDKTKKRKLIDFSKMSDSDDDTLSNTIRMLNEKVRKLQKIKLLKQKIRKLQSGIDSSDESEDESTSLNQKTIASHPDKVHSGTVITNISKEGSGLSKQEKYSNPNYHEDLCKIDAHSSNQVVNHVTSKKDEFEVVPVGMALKPSKDKRQMGKSLTDSDSGCDTDDMIAKFQAKNPVKVKSVQTDSSSDTTSCDDKKRTNKVGESKKETTTEPKIVLKVSDPQIVKSTHHVSKDNRSETMPSTDKISGLSRNKTVVENGAQRKVVQSASSAAVVQKDEKHKLDNAKRLKSLKERQITNMTQKLSIQAALKNVDSKTPNKRILFDDDNSDDSDRPVEKKSMTVGVQDKLKTSLFPDMSDDDDANEFAIPERPEFDGKDGHKLMALQTKIGLDKRFRVDEKFIEDDSDGDTADKEKDVNSEQKRSIDIMQDILKSVNTFPSFKSRNLAKTANVATVRFDPSCVDHEKYELKAEVKKVDERKVVKKKKKENTNAENIVAIPEVSNERFYEVAPTLHDVFTKTTAERFSFFGNEDKNIEQVPVEDYPQPESISFQKPIELSFTDDKSHGDSILPTGNINMTTTKKNQFFISSNNNKIKEGINFFHCNGIMSMQNNDRKNLAEMMRMKRKRALHQSSSLITKNKKSLKRRKFHN